MRPEQPVDQAVREAALDVSRSFIVQAPAGSGKTGLLTQRYLALLARVAAPEEIVAITFTRKAAAEMRERILGALQKAASGEPAENDHERCTLELAAAALAQDAREGWALLSHPARLRILTFDALCAALVRQMPVLSGFGATPSVVEEAGALYREAASQILEQLESREAIGHAVADLLRHLDNRHGQVQDLVAGMLAHRDQWLRHLAGDSEHRRRETLEAALERIVIAELQAIRAAFPDEYRQEMFELLCFAIGQLDDEAELAVCRGLDDLPPATPGALPQWQALANWLLTTSGDYRKSPNRSQGFPAKNAGADAQEKERFADMKARMVALLDALREEGLFGEALRRVAILPLPHYTDNQWRVLEALFALLVQTVAHLRLVFQESGEVDFAEIAMQAVAALGSPQAPTDLALQLDYRIRHLLVDEFQDTSFNQYELLQRLTAGWMPDDGRTLFLVGDPMQSIYRFREAEVGLFLDVKQNGLGDVQLDFLQLSVNFRSQAGIIDWVNATFPTVFPPVDDETVGAVAYSPSRAQHPALPGPAVHLHPFAKGEEAEEAETVTRIVQAALAEDPKGSVAILVRSRSHLLQIIPALREAGIRFQAVEIDPLAARPVVQDLLSLTRALLHPADRIAWLALLRSPLCGLTQADLLALAGGADDVIFPRLSDPACREALSPDGQRIITRIEPLLAEALQRHARLPLRDAVEQTWLALGGPACYPDPVAHADAEAYLERLETLDAGGDVDDFAGLLQAVADLHARADSGESVRVQLMTIHKAKGLEFDTVIVPGLGKAPRADDRQLLYWQELPLPGGETVLLFGPVPGAGEENDATVGYLRQLDKAKSVYESQRLLYVAVTRARRRLHLCGHANRNRKGEVKPASDTLLALLWPVVSSTFVEALESRESVDDAQAEQPEEESPADEIRPQLRRLPPDWQCPEPPPAVSLIRQVSASDETPEIEFDWAGETARHVGTVVHGYLEFLGQGDAQRLQAFTPADHYERIRIRLQQLGVPNAHLEAACQRVRTALEQVLQDERGRWILSPDHADAHSEYPLTGMIEGMPHHYIVDRTFVDETGTRWIIDYKTSRHEGGGLDEFLDREVERYRAQLENYARLFAPRESRPIRLGLYFPLLCGWRMWAWSNES